MSKAQLKKYLKSLTEEQLIQVILDTYDARKEAKEYLEYFLNPDENAAYEKTRTAVLSSYFNKKGKTLSKVSVKEANKTITDFIKLEPSPKLVADILFYNFELMISRLAIRHIASAQAWDIAVNSFRKAIDYITSYSIELDYENRIRHILHYTERNAPAYLEITDRLLQEIDQSGSSLVIEPIKDENKG